LQTDLNFAFTSSMAMAMTKMVPSFFGWAS
jgi:hypothetical protein